MLDDGLSNPAFQATFINSTTVLITQDGSCYEQPLTYVKIYPDLLHITDTGTASPRPATPLAKAKCEPLNPPGRKRYMAICSHAHFDHILGISSSFYAAPPPFIVVSGNSPSFVMTDLPTHSLCKFMDVSTPESTISHWMKHLEYLAHPASLQVRCLNIPGYTPDSHAWYVIEEHHLYVGIRLPWQDAAMVFPAEGDWMNLLISFSAHENTKLAARETASSGIPFMAQQIKVGYGYVTFAGDAENMMREVKDMSVRILEGEVPVVDSFERRGLTFDFWSEGGSEYVVGAPRKLCEEARRKRGLEQR
ncbi:hypothetical protein BJ878DRAFT_581102 [Calycina marina]|uniref:Metallo-beta-lactamase domain-containing protein n=1 Tax=Calycina marina TaxID=1763456 RepID=A0A9P8CHE4_9HELO|nr:hypothetical protein BJ878DRAFT_581102 [Calycina marina]